MNYILDPNILYIYDLYIYHISVNNLCYKFCGLPVCAKRYENLR